MVGKGVKPRYGVGSVLVLHVTENKQEDSWDVVAGFV